MSLITARGLVLDAGCGDGVDMAIHSQRAGVEVIGVELSDGGCRTSFERSLYIASAHVVQADLRQLPFADRTFAFAYSYGVIHHIATPEQAVGELVRVMRTRAQIAVYLYEDFSERAPGLRRLLRAVNSVRVLTTCLPPGLLYSLCWLGSPVVFLLFAVPFRILCAVPLLRTVVLGMPYRHAKGPFSLAGDLYDRFSAPIEYRYGRTGAAALLEQAGLRVLAVSHHRGWMVAAERPAETSAGAL